MDVVVIDYGAGNLFSVVTALKKLNCKVVCSCDPAVICAAERIIFPGVGQASAAMKQLKVSGLERIIPNLKMPVLGICLGMQLMCRKTEEENTTGLNIFPLEVRQFAGDCKIPHMGWNNIRELQSGLFRGIKPGEWMYFVHSYRLPRSEYDIAVCDYGHSFAAAVRKDNFYGCQFHPEKSSEAGEKILKNFLMLEK